MTMMCCCDMGHAVWSGCPAERYIWGEQRRGCSSRCNHSPPAVRRRTIIVLLLCAVALRPIQKKKNAIPHVHGSRHGGCEIFFLHHTVPSCCACCVLCPVLFPVGRFPFLSRECVDDVIWFVGKGRI